MPESKYGKYIVSELKLPESKKKIAEFYATYASRVLWMDDNVVEGAFHMNTSWFLKASTTTENEPHAHDSDEIIGFYGNNAQDPYDLGGEIEFWLEDEKHILTRSCLLFIPAGMKHCPLIIRRVDRPIFHYTVVIGGQNTREDRPPK